MSPAEAGLSKVKECDPAAGGINHRNTKGEAVVHYPAAGGTFPKDKKHGYFLYFLDFT
jgi:hypothetical protein